MKSQGINIEESQITKKDWLVKMCTLTVLASVKILQLTLCRTGEINRSASAAFSKKELDCMEMLVKKYEGKTQKQKNPYKTRSMAWCHWIIARLGGWKGYVQSEGLAGPVTIKEGLERFTSIFEGWTLLFKDVCIT